MTLTPAFFILTNIILGIAWHELPGAAILCSVHLCGQSYFVYRLLGPERRRWLIPLIGGLSSIGATAFYIKQQEERAFYAFMEAYDAQPIQLIADVTDVSTLHYHEKAAFITARITHAYDQYHVQTAYPCNRSISFYTHTLPTVHAGDTIHIPHHLIHMPRDESFIHYLLKERLLSVQAYAPRYYVIKHPRYSWRDIACSMRNRALSRIADTLPPSTYALFSFIFLGNKKIDPTIAQPIKEQFARWGIIHYLARSGLHVSLLMLMLRTLLMLVPLGYRAKYSIGIFVIGIYTTLSWITTSFVRATLTSTLAWLCIMLQVPINLLHLTLLTGTIILLWNPFYLFALDYQLTMALTVSLIWAHKSL